ncbi:MAG: hypothetical protein DRN78_01780 [Thermoproteota archaeon]|nr:MAG: hypothetical protein DRN78_01780 [Candidatus Korarchaeota archaeon]
MADSKSRPGKLKRILALFGEEWLKNKLQELYQNLLSIKKVTEALNKELEKHNIRIGKDLVYRVMNLYGIRRLPAGPRSEIIRKLGGEERAREILMILYEKLRTPKKVQKALQGEISDPEITAILKKYDIEPFEVKYITVYHLMDRMKILKRRKIRRRKYEEVIKALGGIGKAKRLIETLYNSVKIVDNKERLMTINDVTKELNKILASRGIKISARITKELMNHLGIKKRIAGIRLPIAPFNGTKEEMLYLWALCKGDAHIVKLRSGRIFADFAGKDETAFCFLAMLIEYNPNIKRWIKNLPRSPAGYAKFRIILDESFNFLLKKPQEIVKEIKNIEQLAAYLAGLIDSEGNITAKKRYYGYIKRDKKIEISNKDKELIDVTIQLLKNHNFHPRLNKDKRTGVWIIALARSIELKFLIPKLLKYVKHAEKREKLKEALALC